jgi:hypothetical protein
MNDDSLGLNRTKATEQKDRLCVGQSVMGYSTNRTKGQAMREQTKGQAMRGAIRYGIFYIPFLSAIGMWNLGQTGGLVPVLGGGG